MAGDTLIRYRASPSSAESLKNSVNTVLPRRHTNASLRRIDIILIGGPKVNRFVRELEDKGLLKEKITNDYPGSHKGIIQKIKNPYGNGYIYILAGSDRWGTKAAITAFLKAYDDENVLMVEWDNENVKVIS